MPTDPTTGHETRGWQPIATAPKDGTPVLVYSESVGHVIARYDEQREPTDWTAWRVMWDDDRLAREPIAWMPLPDPPVSPGPVPA